MDNNIYKANPTLLKNLHIIVVGCGKTGSLVLTGLCELVRVLQRLEPSRSIDITAYDGNTVSAANIDILPFLPAKIGENKATVIVNRLNMIGFKVKAAPRYFSEWLARSNDMLIIGCVGSRESRRIIKEQLKDYDGYYIDCSNGLYTGQVIIGCQDKDYKLPMPWDVCPDLFSDVLEAKNKQNLIVSRQTANIALQLTWQLLYRKQLKSQGCFFDCQSMKAKSIIINT